MNYDNDYDQNDFDSTHFPFKIGAKGRLTTTHTHPRKLKQGKDNDYETFVSLLGSEEQAQLQIAEFNKLNNSKNASQIAMADGVLSNLIHVQNVSARVMQSVLKVGNDRYYRLKKHETKKKSGGLNGLQVTKEMIEEIVFFLNFLVLIINE